jgi:hypothetical protein
MVPVAIIKTGVLFEFHKVTNNVMHRMLSAFFFRCCIHSSTCDINPILVGVIVVLFLVILLKLEC